MRASARASAAPTQKCGPCPKARWVRALARPTSKRSAPAKWPSSRLAEPYITRHAAPAGMVTPPTSTSTVVVRNSICTGDS